MSCLVIWRVEFGLVFVCHHIIYLDVAEFSRSHRNRCVMRIGKRHWRSKVFCGLFLVVTDSCSWSFFGNLSQITIWKSFIKILIHLLTFQKLFLIELEIYLRGSFILRWTKVIAFSAIDVRPHFFFINIVC